MLYVFEPPERFNGCATIQPSGAGADILGADPMSGQAFASTRLHAWPKGRPLVGSRWFGFLLTLALHETDDVRRKTLLAIRQRFRKENPACKQAGLSTPTGAGRSAPLTSVRRAISQ
jgi:hypothetical protein